MTSRLQQRRDTAANWTSNNPTLAAGEFGLETDTGKFKIGTGSTAWNSLSYGGLQGTTGLQGTGGSQGTSGQVNALTINNQSGTTYTLQSSDVNALVIASNSGIQTPVLINTTTSTTTNTVCLGQTATLSASGGNGVYTWSPATGLDTTSGNTVVFTPTAVGTYSFTATSTDNNPLCPQSASSTQTLVVTAVQTPTFNQIPSFCDGTTAPVLPTTSQNGITGSWSPSTVSNTPPGTTTYTFTPDVTQCATPTTMDITVNPGVTPLDRKSTRLNSSHTDISRMPSSA